MAGLRGGIRPGAGRPKGEETVMVRVPKGCLDTVRKLISSYKNQAESFVSSSKWQPLSSLPDPDRRIDLWCVQDDRCGCVYDVSSDNYLDGTRRKAYWVLKATAWRYSELVVAPDF